MTKVVAQTKHFGVAFILMWAVAKIPLGYLSRLALPLYIVAMVLLVLTALIGDQAKGAQRWLDLQVIRIQPSELMKIALPLMLAWYFDRYERVLNLKHYFIAAILLVAPVILILKQPDLGTSILVLASGFFCPFVCRNVAEGAWFYCDNLCFSYAVRMEHARAVSTNARSHAVEPCV